MDDNLERGGMMARIKELRSIIYDRYESESELANELGWPKQKLNRITNGQQEPNLEELMAMADKFEMSATDLIRIFLQNKSPNRQHATA